MLRELKNEAKISVILHTKSSLTIRSAQTKVMDPTLLDMQCIKSRYKGKDTVIIPGSSLKGVIRSRYEKIVNLFGGECCDIFDSRQCCHRPKDWEKKPYEEQGEFVYQNMCHACQLFGSLSIASRINITDAYPISECIMGERAGVGINRITGAAQNGALYDFEVVEDGSFLVEMTLKNYELYQMALLMFVLEDLDKGYISLGAASTRGNGRMEIQKLDIYLREYRKNVKSWRGAIDKQEILLNEKYGMDYEWKLPFYGEIKLQDIKLDEMIENCKSINIQNKVRRKIDV